MNGMSSGTEKNLFSHVESNARGVATLIIKHLDVKINEVKTDTNGIFILLDCTIADC